MLNDIIERLSRDRDYHREYGIGMKRQDPLDFVRMILAFALKEEEHKNDMCSLQTSEGRAIYERAPRSQTEKVLRDCLRNVDEIDSENRWLRGSLDRQKDTTRQAMNLVDKLATFTNVIRFNGLTEAKLKEMMEWCDHSLKKGHQYMRVDGQGFFIFDDKAEAALFKMFWVE